MRSFDYVVVGAGPAGMSAARTLAQQAGSGRVALVSDEAALPYERPQLSKETLASADNPIVRLTSDLELEQLGIAFLGGTRARAIDREARILQTDVGPLSYGALLLATGGAARALRAPGSGLENVKYLRSEADAQALRTALAARPRIVVIGAGFIGLEVAATAHKLGCRVDVVANEAMVMGRCLPRAIGERAQALLISQGIALRLAAEVAALEGKDKVLAVRLASGECLPADLVVVGIGSVPNTSLAAEAGLAIDDGIVVGADWRTSDPHIFAAGDVARRTPRDFHGGRGVRLESWEPALEHGQLVARAMLGQPVDEPGVPWMWSDQADLNVQIAGAPNPADPFILRERDESVSLAAAFLDSGRIVGAITLNDGAAMATMRRAIAERRSVNPDAFRDPAVPLRQALGMQRSSERQALAT